MTWRKRRCRGPLPRKFSTSSNSWPWMSSPHTKAGPPNIEIDGCHATQYIVTVISSFKHKGLKELFETGHSKHVAHDLRKKVKIRLDTLNASSVPSGMNVPGWRLHELQGDRKGTWSVDVSGNWRVTFRFEKGDGHDVNLEDTHKK
jgi:proteic killer suppression protein